nr:hypothetical protein BaRGS_011525 [Batillaria attramentaria]
MNCTHYFECSTDGVRTPIRCAAGTVANPNGDDIFTICTWSDEVPECRASHQQTNEVDPRLQDACNVPTSSDIRPGQAYHVPHPLYCNGYLTCGRDRQAALESRYLKVKALSTKARVISTKVKVPSTKVKDHRAKSKVKVFSAAPPSSRSDLPALQVEEILRALVIPSGSSKTKVESGAARV